MKRLVGISILAVGLNGCSELSGGIEIDAITTSQYCSVLNEAQFNAVSNNKTAMAKGTIGKYKFDAVTQRSDDAAYDVVFPSAVDRNTIKVARAIAIKLSSSGQFAYVKTKKDALIQMTSEGPICGSPDLVEK